MLFSLKKGGSNNEKTRLTANKLIELLAKSCRDVQREFLELIVRQNLQNSFD